METKEQVKHTFEGKCGCGIYHYHCDVCGVDCTIGTKAGPPTKETDGKTRCYECQDKFRIAQNLLIAAVPDLIDALRGSLAIVYANLCPFGVALRAKTCDCNYHQDARAIESALAKAGVLREKHA